MAITLADIQVNLTDDLDKLIIDDFRKNSFIFNNIPFHDCVSPVGGGTTLTYAYDRVTTQRGADFRAFNTDYTVNEAKKTRYTVDLKPFGGSFTIDRVFAGTGGIVDEIQFQLAQLTKATAAQFTDACINGDSAIDANSFDGLDKALTGSDTEVNAGVNDSVIDLSTSSAVTSNHLEFLDIMNEFLSTMDGRPSAIIGNTAMVNKIKAAARRVDSLTTTMDEFGRQVSTYDGIPLIDAGAKSGSNDPIIPTDENDGTTSLYAVRFGMDGFHAVSKSGGSPITTYLPDFADASVMGKGGVEMLAAVALKSTKAAAVLRNIQVVGGK